DDRQGCDASRTAALQLYEGQRGYRHVSVTPSLGDERGAVLVMVGAMLLPFVLLVSFVIETGWWWTHHKHLQVEADSAGLPGAAGPWLPLCDDSPTDSTSLVGKAILYSGDQNRYALLQPQPSVPAQNQQYSNASNVHVLFNSKDYWDNGGSDNSAVGGSPCAS